MRSSSLAGQNRQHRFLFLGKGVFFSPVAIWPEFAQFDGNVLEAMSIDAAYAVYLERQAADVVARQKEEGRVIPDGFDYDRLPGLSNELKKKLNAVRPASIGQMERIEGMTPAAVALVLANLKRSNLGQASVNVG